MCDQIDKHDDRRIMCVGMCVLDIIHVCADFPEEDTDKRCLQGYWQRGGNASNNCTVLRQLGAECEFLGMLSNSKAFHFLQDDCLERGIHIANCPCTEKDPPFSSVILTQTTGTRTIIHSNDNFPILQYEHFKTLNLNAYSWIHFEGRNPEHTTSMLEHIKRHNEQLVASDCICVSLELEKKRADFLPLAHFVNYVFIGKDFANYMGWSNMQEAVYGLRNKLCHDSQYDGNTSTPPAIICSWGAAGSCCLDELDNFAEIPAQSVVNIVDSLGAGDTFCAATIYALQYKRLLLHDAVAFGNRCAAYKIEYRGYDQIYKIKLNTQ